MNDIKSMSDEQLAELSTQIQNEIGARAPKTTTVYLYRDKDTNYETGQRLGLTDAQLENFKYCGYEVAVTLEIDRDGLTMATHLGGVALAKKVTI